MKFGHLLDQGQLKVLIAEDKGDIRALYQKALPDEGFEKIWAADGEEALALYEKHRPDVVLLDIMMPAKSGYQVLKEIRRDFKDDQTAVIMATALSGEEDVRDCLTLGIQGYIVKPFDRKTLADKIRAYYDQSRKMIDLALDV
jgi:DNA-binding response OmpR family regulator